MSRLHGLFYGALLCALFGITPSLYMGTVMRDGNLSGIPIYFLTYQFVNEGNPCATYAGNVQQNLYCLYFVL